MTNPTSNLYSDVARKAEPLATPQSALAIGAHPDDIEFGAAGTLTRWARERCRITMLVVTDGSKGTWDPDLDPADLVNMRQAEQRAAAEIIGVSEVRYLDHVDGELEYTVDLRREICRQIRELQPEVLLSHDPWKRYQLHPDHRATGWAAMDAVISARDHLFYPEQGLDSHRPAAVLLWSADEPDHWEEITETFSAKIAALLCHSSQGTTTMGGAEQGEDHRNEFVERMRAWAEREGTAVGLEAAEAFKRITP